MTLTKRNVLAKFELSDLIDCGMHRPTVNHCKHITSQILTRSIIFANVVRIVFQLYLSNLFNVSVNDVILRSEHVHHRRIRWSVVLDDFNGKMSSSLRGRHLRRPGSNTAVCSLYSVPLHAGIQMLMIKIQVTAIIELFVT
jgi:hypothetical protein